MEFKKFSTLTSGYQVNQQVKEKDDRDAPNIQIQKMDSIGSPIDFDLNPDGLVFRNEDELNQIKMDTYHAEHANLREVLMHLAICHTVVVDKNKGVYNAASPDELALVEGAKDRGYEFLRRDPGNIIVIKDP